MEQADRAFAISVRRHLHQYPELSLKEFKTAAYIRRKLAEFGLEYVAVGETGTFAGIEGGKGQGRRVLLRADIDALPMEEKTGLLSSLCMRGSCMPAAMICTRQLSWRRLKGSLS